jgi:hypothetical protein
VTAARLAASADAHRLQLQGQPRLEDFSRPRSRLSPVGHRCAVNAGGISPEKQEVNKDIKILLYVSRVGSDFPKASDFPHLNQCRIACGIAAQKLFEVFCVLGIGDAAVDRTVSETHPLFIALGWIANDPASPVL